MMLNFVDQFKPFSLFKEGFMEPDLNCLVYVTFESVSFRRKNVCFAGNLECHVSWQCS